MGASAQRESTVFSLCATHLPPSLPATAQPCRVASRSVLPYVAVCCRSLDRSTSLLLSVAACCRSLDRSTTSLLLSVAACCWCLFGGVMLAAARCCVFRFSAVFRFVRIRPHFCSSMLDDLTTYQMQGTYIRLASISIKASALCFPVIVDHTFPLLMSIMFFLPTRQKTVYNYRNVFFFPRHFTE